MSANSSWQVYASSTDAWLDQQALSAIRAELPALADEVLRAIQQEVPAYSRPLSGEFGRGIRTGTELALRRFIGDETDGSLAVYRSLGSGEHRAGRSLDALQSAYRVGARVAWRRMSHTAAAVGASAEAQRNLAEAMFAYIDQLAGESIEGYTERQVAQAGDLERRRAALIAVLLDGAPADAAKLESTAEAAGWVLPRTVVCLVVAGDLASTAPRRLSGDVLARQHGSTTCIVVPNPAGLEQAAQDLATRLHLRVGLGPTVTLADAQISCVGRGWRKSSSRPTRDWPLLSIASRRSRCARLPTSSLRYASRLCFRSRPRACAAAHGLKALCLPGYATGARSA